MSLPGRELVRSYSRGGDWYSQVCQVRVSYCQPHPRRRVRGIGAFTISYVDVRPSRGCSILGLSPFRSSSVVRPTFCMHTRRVGLVFHIGCRNESLPFCYIVCGRLFGLILSYPDRKKTLQRSEVERNKISRKLYRLDSPCLLFVMCRCGELIRE